VARAPRRRFLAATPHPLARGARGKLTTRPVIALVTDFGTVDPFVGVMKGVLAARCPEATVIDVTHAIPPQRIVEGAFWLERTARWFGEATVFVAVVDPGVGTSRRALAARAHGRVFVGPDNGVLAPVLRRDPAAVAYAIDVAALGLPRPSATFHGRDVFSPVAAEIAAGRLRLEDVGEPVVDYDDGGLPAPAVSESGARGMVVTVDRFGNLMTDLDGDIVRRLQGPGAPAEVRLGTLVLPLRRTYADVGDGEYVALLGAFDVVEIARRNGNAAQSSSLGRDEPVRLTRVR
jgi:S-adenosylmethionine hydrolase